MAKQHERLIIEDSRFVINPSWPYVGASPDGMIHCMCCGKGTLEIKCSFSHREEGIEAWAQNIWDFGSLFVGEWLLRFDSIEYVHSFSRDNNSITRYYSGYSTISNGGFRSIEISSSVIDGISCVPFFMTPIGINGH